MVVPLLRCDVICAMFKRKRSVNKQQLEHKLYLSRETPEPIFDISDCDLIDIPNGVFSLCKVFLKESLTLQNNQLSSLSGGGDLKDLTHLKILDISHNDFYSLTDEVCLLKNLQELYLDNNHLKHLPDSLCLLVNLKILSVNDNKLKTLPDELGKMKKLQRASLKNNLLTKLPPSVCMLKKLTAIEVDSEHFIYPPSDITARGPKEILKFLCEDVGVDYAPTSAEEVELSEVDEADAWQGFKERMWDLEDAKMRRLQEFLEIEKNNELKQRQEFEIASVHRANKEKLLASITGEQSRFDQQLNRIHQERETDRFRLLEQLQEAEENAANSINILLQINKEPAKQLLEREKEEEEKLLAAVNRHNENLKKEDILAAMQDILRQETEMFNKFDRDRIETSRTILEQELDTDSNLSRLLHNQDLHKAVLVSQLQEDNYLQRAAVGTLLERGDARSWGILQQVRMVEAQLCALTNIEIDRQRLKMDRHLNDLSEKRVDLSVLLIDLLDQQKQRRAQLLETLQVMEEYNREKSEDFWLMQYQRLLEKFPEGLSQAQKNIDPMFAEILLANGVLHCLPFLAKFTQCQFNAKSITDLHLAEAGLTSFSDRKKILDCLQIYSKEFISNDFTASAPVEESSASAPPDIRSIKSAECVVCLDIECHVIFVPCGHLCCCADCSINLKECPLCRTQIDRKITIIQ